MLWNGWFGESIEFLQWEIRSCMCLSEITFDWGGSMDWMITLSLLNVQIQGIFVSRQECWWLLVHQIGTWLHKELSVCFSRAHTTWLVDLQCLRMTQNVKCTQPGKFNGYCLAAELTKMSEERVKISASSTGIYSLLTKSGKLCQYGSKDFNPCCALFSLEHLILWGYFNLFHSSKINCNEFATNLMVYSKLAQGVWWCPLFLENILDFDYCNEKNLSLYKLLNYLIVQNRTLPAFRANRAQRKCQQAWMCCSHPCCCRYDSKIAKNHTTFLTWHLYVGCNCGRSWAWW